MKGTNKAKAQEQPKMDDEAIRDTDSIGSSTPEITTRSDHLHPLKQQRGRERERGEAHEREKERRTRILRGMDQ
jgi:hypothetical protein